MSGLSRITEKPIVDSMNDVDYLVCISEGAVMRVEPESTGTIPIVDIDDGNKKYFCQMFIRDGHLVLTATVRENDDNIQ